MPDSFAITALTTFVISNAPFWLNALQGTLLNRGGEIALEKSTHFVRSKLHLDEKEQLYHLERALKHAIEAGQARFQDPTERGQYYAVLSHLSEPEEQGDALRREALRLFTLSELPDLVGLNILYNRSLQTRTLGQPTPPPEIDAAPYLNAFFEALVAAFYADPFFRRQMSDVLHLRLARSMQLSLTEVSGTLQKIDETLAGHYTTEQFEEDLVTYTAHMERTFHYLKLVGVVPKDRGSENIDPELNAIFVPLRLAPEDTKMRDGRLPISIIGWLERSSNLVLLGGPGSGKSTATRYLSWSHAAIHLKPLLISPSSVPLLSGRPLPLRIELRRLSEERHQQPNLDFLDYAVRVLLGRAGTHIKRQMFVELLTQGGMLCLFDGLDEVATLDERRRLIDEIEDFVQCYPSNRVVVTSRPVGYDLARLSNQLFTHTCVEEFNNQQIGVFLERWYTHVLRLSPLPPDDREELEKLYTTLTENPRLHTLATNPLLLTVITALHRYERLPDRRILVYDRCADLLLDTWAKIKGTDGRWRDMQMGKEDQFACVAHLGFVLHERSQEKREGSTTSVKASSTTSVASDVPTRFLLKEIERFLKDRRLLSEIAEQRAEARRFFELMQVEAGLIVERGKGEGGEDLYGFVHRTFQEYFAAADVYERYQQEEDSTIISQFLQEHLHDPHWHEVILLLLAKLKRRPATIQLRQILESKSRLSRYVDILHQDLFFVCTCLAEDIAVDIELAESVIVRISDLVKQAPFPSQRRKGLDALTSLMRTRQYAFLGREKIRVFATQEVLSDPIAKVYAVHLFYKSYAGESQEQRVATQKLLEVIRRNDLTVEQSIKAADTLYLRSPTGAYEKRVATRKLLELMQRDDLTIEQNIEVADMLCHRSPAESQEQQQATQKLLELMQRDDLTIEQSIEAADKLRWHHSAGSQEQQQATQKLLEVMQRNDLTIEQYIKAAQVFSWDYLPKLQERQLVRQKLLEVLQRNDLTIEQSIEAAKELYWSRFPERQQALQKLLELIQREDLTIEQYIKAAKVFYWWHLPESPEQRQTLQKLLEVIQRDGLTVEQNIEVADMLYHSSLERLPERQLVRQKLLEIMWRADLPIEQSTKAAGVIYCGSSYGSQEKQRAGEKLLEVIQGDELAIEQSIEAADALYRGNFYEAQEQQLAIQSLVEFMQRPNLPFEAMIQVAQELCQFFQPRFRKSQQYRQIILKLEGVLRWKHLAIEQRIEAIEAIYISSDYETYEWWNALQMIMDLPERADVVIEHKIRVIQAFYKARAFYSWDMDQMVERLLELVQDPGIPLEQSMEVAQVLHSALGEKQLIIDKLVDLIQHAHASIEQKMRVAHALYVCGEMKSQERQQATEELVELVKRTNLLIEQSIDAAQALYNSCVDESQEQQQATRKLVELVAHTDLSPEQHIRAVQALYCNSALGSSERQLATQKLWQQASDQNLSVDQRLRSVLVPLTVQDANYVDRAQSLRIAFTLFDEESAVRQVKSRWRAVGSNNKAQATDIPCLVELVNNERLPIELRDEVYKALESMIPEFGNIVDGDPSQKPPRR